VVVELKAINLSSPRNLVRLQVPRQFIISVTSTMTTYHVTLTKMATCTFTTYQNTVTIHPKYDYYT
jgi:hypothetical protein